MEHFLLFSSQTKYRGLERKKDWFIWIFLIEEKSDQNNYTSESFFSFRKEKRYLSSKLTFLTKKNSPDKRGFEDRCWLDLTQSLLKCNILKLGYLFLYCLPKEPSSNIYFMEFAFYGKLLLINCILSLEVVELFLHLSRIHIKM